MVCVARSRCGNSACRLEESSATGLERVTNEGSTTCILIDACAGINLQAIASLGCVCVTAHLHFVSTFSACVSRCLTWACMVVVAPDIVQTCLESQQSSTLGDNAMMYKSARNAVTHLGLPTATAIESS